MKMVSRGGSPDRAAQRVPLTRDRSWSGVMAARRTARQFITYWWTRLRWGSLPMTGSSTHPLRVRIRRAWWPPFYSTALFLPRFTVKARNEGPLLEKASMSWYVAEYDGPISDVPSATEGWRDVHHSREISNWNPGAKKKFTLKIAGRFFPRQGTYALRFVLQRHVHSPGSLHDDLMDAFSEMPEPERSQRVQQILQSTPLIGLNPYAPQPGRYKIDQVYTGHVFDYIRIEPLSNVLTFFVVVAALATAITTLVVALST